jgi:hypothetical protein
VEVHSAEDAARLCATRRWRIRQGAALENYLWLDSQDIGGVDKELLRSVPVWILGVQREGERDQAHAVEHPATVAKPKPADVALLELGQFYACWGKHAITSRPASVDAHDLAQKVATGKLDVRNAAAIASGASVLKAARASFPDHIDREGRGHYIQEDSVTKDEAARLERENAQLKADNADLRRRLEALEKGRQHDTAGTKTERPRAARVESDHTDAAAQSGRPKAAAAGETSTNGHVDEALTSDQSAAPRGRTDLPESDRRPAGDPRR